MLLVHSGDRATVLCEVLPVASLGFCSDGGSPRATSPRGPRRREATTLARACNHHLSVGCEKSFIDPFSVLTISSSAH